MMKRDKPVTDRIAAIVPCHNRKEKTLRFIPTFLAQTYPNLDLILVDAASQDGTAEAVRSIAPDVILLSVSADCYWTATTNAGVKYALQQGYDYILTINDDCLIEPDHVEQLITIAQKYSFPIVGSRIEHQDQPGLICGMGLSPNWITSLFSYHYRDQYFHHLSSEIQSAELLETITLPGNGTLIHRSVFETVGLYEAVHLPHYLSDVELVMRARRAGFRVGVLPQAVLQDDFPTPTQRAAQRALQQASLTCFWKEFHDSFFHIRSGGKLSARFFLIWTYCPWYLMPIAFGMCGLSVLVWTARFLTRFLKGQLSWVFPPMRGGVG